jgi:ParB family chromosome partitioning protein
MQLEFHQLDLRYKHLRVTDAGRQRRLVGSLAEQGQQTPVMVIKGDDNRFVLIDGYLRVQGLKKLGQDTVDAVVVELSERDALLYRYGMQNKGGRSALEEGWLLHELSSQHGMTQTELAARLERSVSWVSRRLALVRDLPPEGHQLVRTASVCPHAAMKYLVPLARANRSDCLLLIEGLAKHKVSERQLKQLYRGWHSVDREQWQRICDKPLLYLKVTEADSDDGPSWCTDVQLSQRQLRSDLRALGAICWRARQRLTEHDTDKGPLVTSRVMTAFHTAEAAFLSLKTTIEDNGNAGLRDTHGDSAASQAGIGASDDSADTEHLPQLGQESPAAGNGSTASATTSGESCRAR